MTYESLVLAESPLLNWRLNDISGTTAADASGNSRVGTYSGGITLGGSSPITSDGTSKSIGLDGSTGKVTSSYNPFSGTRTFFGWANRANHSVNNALFYTNSGGCRLEVTTGGSVNWYPNFIGDISTTWASVWPGDAQWVFWLLTHNGSTHQAELFLNGISKTVKATAAYYSSPGNIILANAEWPGSMTEFAITPSIISSANQLAIYNAAISTSSGRPKAFISGSWTKKPAKVFVAGSWIEKPVKKWNGSSWVAVT